MCNNIGSVSRSDNRTIGESEINSRIDSRHCQSRRNAAVPNVGEQESSIIIIDQVCIDYLGFRRLKTNVTV
jgi:hypothetical protein